MKKFTLNHLDEVTGRIVMYKLIIDGKCLLDHFITHVEEEGQYVDELSSIFAHIEDYANLVLLPVTKFRIIKNRTKEVTSKEYEFKSKHLRVYGIKALTGSIIIMGGYKITQKKDLNKLRRIKSEYLKSISK